MARRDNDPNDDASPDTTARQNVDERMRVTSAPSVLVPEERVESWLARTRWVTVGDERIFDDLT